MYMTAIEISIGASVSERRMGLLRKVVEAVGSLALTTVHPQSPSVISHMYLVLERGNSGSVAHSQS